MPRTPDPDIVDRDARIVRAYLDNKGQNLTELGRQFNTTYHNVHRILTTAGVWNPAERETSCRRPRAKFRDLRAPNVWFSAVGHKLWYWRSHQPDTTREIGRPDLAKMLGMSTFRVSQIEMGIALDLTLMEICKIAKCLGTTPEDLIKPQNPVTAASSSPAPSNISRSASSGTEFGRVQPIRRSG